MELRHLYYVITLAEEKNYSKAADRLFITQPTLSQQIKHLEDELGIPLFTRTTKKVELTPTGTDFVKRAKKVVKEYESLTDWTNLAAHKSALTLTLGASSITTPHVTTSLSDFISSYPDVTIDFVEQWDPMLLTMVRDGSVDFSLSSYPVKNSGLSGLKCYPICAEYVCAVISKKNPLADREFLKLEDLEKEHIVTTSPSSGLTNLMIKAFTESGIIPSFNMNAVSIEARLALVEKGSITFVLNEQFKSYTDMDADVRVIPIEPKIYRELAVVTQASRKLTSLEKDLIATLHAGTARRLHVEPIPLEL